MTIVVWVCAVLAGVLHVVVFCWESLLLHRRFVHEKVFATPREDLPAIRLWSFGLGFYNLFLGLGAIAGVGFWALGDPVVGRTLVVYTCLFMVLCAVVLLVADRMALGRPRGAGLGGVVSQGLLPLVALVVTWLT